MVKITVKEDVSNEVIDLLEDYVKDENGFIISTNAGDNGALAEVFLEDAQIPFLMQFDANGEAGNSVFMPEEGCFNDNDDKENFERVKGLFLEYCK